MDTTPSLQAVTIPPLLAATEVADILQLKPAALRKQVERGTIPTPDQTTPRMAWDHAAFWDWYYATKPRRYDPDTIPFEHWPSIATAAPQVTFTHRGVQTTYRHPLGEIAVIHPTTNEPPAPIWGRNVVAVVTDRADGNGFIVDVDAPNQRRTTRTTTATLARIIGQPLLYWPEGLRAPSFEKSALAALPADTAALGTLQGLTPLVTDPALKHLLEQHIQALHSRAHERAVMFVEKAETPVLMGDTAHLAIQIRPMPVPHSDFPDWNRYTSMVVGEDAYATTAAKAARDSWGLSLEGVRTLPVHGDAAVAFSGSLVRVREQDTTVGHLFLESTLRDDLFTYPLLPGVVAAMGGYGLRYTAPAVVGPVDDAAVLDLEDPTNPFVFHDGAWLPLPRHGWSGVNAGYSGSGPGALTEVVRAARHGDVPGSRLLTCPLLEGDGFPRRTTVGEVLGSVEAGQ